MPFRRPKWWNLAEKRWTSNRVLSVDPFPIEKLDQFKRNWILAQKKWAPKRKFLKNAIWKTKTIEFDWKTMILPGSPSLWQISNRKVALICLKLNSGAKKKNDHRNENFEKNAISEAETMEFGRKTINLFRSPICWPISNWKVASNSAKLNFGTKKKEHRNEKF